MTKHMIVAAIGILLTEVLFAQTFSPALTSLVEAERAFAAMSLEKEIKAAFLANLAVDDGILFHPGPVNGKELCRKRSDCSAARLEWAPVYADIAASGDLGYTTGWSVFSAAPAPDERPYYGSFVTLWKKQSDGTWKFALEVGISQSTP